MIERLCIIGVGLIGGSLARALREAAYVKEIVGSSRSAAHLQKAVDLGVIDRYDTDARKAVQGADMVFVSVPLGAMAAVFEAIKGALADTAVVTDAGSAKASVVEGVKKARGQAARMVCTGTSDRRNRTEWCRGLVRRFIQGAPDHTHADRGNGRRSGKKGARHVGSGGCLSE